MEFGRIMECHSGFPRTLNPPFPISQSARPEYSNWLLTTTQARVNLVIFAGLYLSPTLGPRVQRDPGIVC